MHGFVAVYTVAYALRRVRLALEGALVCIFYGLSLSLHVLIALSFFCWYSTLVIVQFNLETLDVEFCMDSSSGLNAIVSSQRHRSTLAISYAAPLRFSRSSN